MKSKKGLLILVLIVIFAFGSWYAFGRGNPLVAHALEAETLDNTFPEKLDEDTVIPYGYTFGVWPKDFQGDPIVTKMTYIKGPPQKFIQEMTQVWKPVEVELALYGPRTIDPKFGASDWRNCFESGFSCKSQKSQYLSYIFPDQKQHSHDQVKLTWFDSLDPIGARGTHLVIKAQTYQIDRYTVITQAGAVQSFSLKAVNGDVGDQARALFLKTLSSMKVKDDLTSSRDWIQNKIKSVNLGQVQHITDPKLRFIRLIQIQNWIYSLLSVDPTHIEPFFHLAGVTHMLAMELLKTDQKYFEGQEAWILSFKPLFETLLRYAKDFPDSKRETENISALLQDILFQQSKMSH